MNPNDPYTQVLLGDEAIKALMVGVDLVCDATKVTLGPRGMNAAIDLLYKQEVMHDGVSTAIAVNPEEPYAKLGASIIKEAARKQRDAVGDGTTLVLVLAQAILKEALKAKASGVNPMSLEAGLIKGREKLIKQLEKLAIPIKTLEEKIQVATISAEDKELGKLIAETIHKIGDEGIITVEESKAPETFVEIVEGMQIDKPFAHPFFMTDIERQMAILEDVHVLITDYPMTNFADWAPFLNEKISKEAKVNKMVFITPDISGDMLQALLESKTRGVFASLVVRAPGFPPHQIEMLQDLCAITGAKFVSKEQGHKIADIDLSWCGKIKRIESNKVNTTITGVTGRKNDILQRIAVIKKQMEDENLSEFDKEQLKSRLGKLTNGIAVVKAGGETEIEMTKHRERAKDAIAATQSACRKGIVAGGETALLNAGDILADSKDLGEQILFHATREPFRKLVSNAGYDAGEKLTELKGWHPIEVSKEHKNKGFDVTDGKFKDMLKEGIIDPVEVPLSAIKTAISVAISLLTIGTAIVPVQKDENK